MSTLRLRLNEEEWRRLQQLAEQRRCAPDELAHKVVSQWLALDEQDWQARMERVLEAFRRHTRGVASAEIEQEITAAFEEYRWVEVTGALQLCRDARDDMVLETALQGKAQYLVSRDDDLKRDLALMAHLLAHGVQIVSVQ